MTSLPLPKFTIGTKVKVGDYILTIQSMNYDYAMYSWNYEMEEVDGIFFEDQIEKID